MKRLLLIGLMASVMGAPAWADRDRGYDRERAEHEFMHRPHPDAHWHPDAGWVIPAIVSGALVYGAFGRPPTVVVQPAPVVTQSYPVQIGQPQYPPPGYHWEQIMDASCNCYRVVLVRN